jgi:hypothetical protein
MSDEIEKTVKDYGNIMELCFLEAGRITSSLEAGRITSSYGSAPELCRQITHDLFEAVTSESGKAKELDIIETLREAAESLRKTDEPSPLDEFVMALLGVLPFVPGVPNFMVDSESGEEPVPPEPENGG